MSDKKPAKKPKKKTAKTPSKKKATKGKQSKKAAPEATSTPAREQDLLDDLGLEPRQQRFVQFYCALDNSYNGTKAYLKAYSPDGDMEYHVAGAAACRLLKDVKIQEAVRREKLRILSDNDSLTKRWLEECATMAFANIGGVMEVDEHGIVRLRKDLTDEQMRTVESLANSEMGIKAFFHSKKEHMNMLGKALGLFVENQRQVGEDYESVVARLSREERGVSDEK